MKRCLVYHLVHVAGYTGARILHSTLEVRMVPIVHIEGHAITQRTLEKY